MPGFDYSSYTPGATMRTLATDVMPIFQTNCAISTACHSKGSVNPPILGDVAGSVTAADVSAAIVNVNSVEVPMLKFVAAGDPQNSYLMRKVEDMNPGCGLTCTSTPATGCMTQMPSGSPPLSAGDQSIIRDWIKQGAK
jgi:hypothetical protein